MYLGEKFKKPLVIGVSESRDQGIDASEVNLILRDLGDNSGNMMFSKALHHSLLASQMTPYQSLYESKIDNGDCIVFAAANWIAEFTDFQWAYDALRQKDIPVFLVGVGAQAGTDFKIPKLKPGTLNFLKLVSERSNFIGTRGDFSSEVLAHYGITNSRPLGCPSLLMAGVKGPKVHVDKDRNGVVLHGTRHLLRASDSLLHSFFYYQARRHNYDILLQSEFADIRIKTLGDDHGLDEKTMEILRKEYRVDTNEELVRFIRSNGKFFSEVTPWIQYYATKKLVVGTRIHGTIAAILAGTPAVLIAHDSRTTELADKMGIPYISGDKIDRSRDLDIDALFSLATSHDYLAQYHPYRDDFIKFFEDNRLQFYDASIYENWGTD